MIVLRGHSSRLQNVQEVSNLLSLDLLLPHIPPFVEDAKDTEHGQHHG
jgi:hypothetical protein